MKIHQSAEDYLETILKLEQRNGSVRSVDIAAEMGFSKPSVCRAMKLLRNDAYIEMEPSGQIKLLEKGRAVAQRIYNRHQVLTTMFIRLGVDPEVAAEDACKVEHDLSEESFDKLAAHLAKTQQQEK